MQKDYRKMSEEQLTTLAEKYHIPPLSQDNNDPWAETFFRRDRVINALLVRDNALRTKWSIGVSVLALLVSLGALVVAIISLIIKYHETVQR